MDALARDLAAIARISAVPTILKTVRQSTGLRFTVVARVMRNRWVACAVHDEIEFGLKVGDELDVATTLCSQVRDSLAPVIIESASTDAHYCNHPSPKKYGFESYISVPIFRRTGEYFGTLCGLDPSARSLNDEKTLSTLKLFSEVISLQLETEEELEGARIELGAARETARLREEFIAVLGHDVRTPLSSITTWAAVLLARSTSEDDRRALARMASSAHRISDLVGDVVDLAQGQLGGGLSLEIREVDGMGARLCHVAEELRALHPARTIDVVIDCDAPLRCDPRRVEQALQNLLANAIEHGYRDSPVVVRVGGDEATMILEVQNRGVPIAGSAIARIFEPYFRSGLTGRKGRGGGLGLGLYIVSQIAKAHDGQVDVQSSDDLTLFRFSIPRRRPSTAPAPNTVAI